MRMRGLRAAVVVSLVLTMLAGCSSVSRATQAVDDIARALGMTRAQTPDLLEREAVRQGTHVDDVARVAHREVLRRADEATPVSHMLAGLTCEVVVQPHGLDDDPHGSEEARLFLLSVRFRWLEQHHPEAQTAQLRLVLDQMMQAQADRGALQLLEEQLIQELKQAVGSEACEKLYG